MSKDSLAYASRRVGRLNGLTHIMFHGNSILVTSQLFICFPFLFIIAQYILSHQLV